MDDRVRQIIAEAVFDAYNPPYDGANPSLNLVNQVTDRIVRASGSPANEIHTVARQIVDAEQLLADYTANLDRWRDRDGKTDPAAIERSTEIERQLARKLGDKTSTGYGYGDCAPSLIRRCRSDLKHLVVLYKKEDER